MTMDNNTGIISKKATEAAAKPQNKNRSMQDYVRSMESEIRKALPTVITAERFTRMTLSALSVNPKLAECTPKSFLGAMMTAAQLGVEPNTALGQAYLIPYKNWKTQQLECQFQLSYKGLLDLAYRSGEISVVQAHTVYANDFFEYELGIDPILKHKPATGDRGEPIAYYAMYKTKDGGFGFEVMSRHDVELHAKSYSKSATTGPWKDNFDEMAKKTVLKKVLKYAPMKSEFTRGVVQDETIKNDISEDMYSVPDENVFEADYEVDVNTGEVISNG